MFDVGGQHLERKKWIHRFEGVTSIIFYTTLSEYDQLLLEELKWCVHLPCCIVLLLLIASFVPQNQMAESLVLFESIINSRWFFRMLIILFLHKMVVYKSKLP
jgi:guanine nucleotide-binding protein G(i) subunit alpha